MVIKSIEQASASKAIYIPSGFRVQGLWRPFWRESMGPRFPSGLQELEYFKDSVSKCSCDIALTATATRKVQIDLIEMLHIPQCVKFVSSVNRPNPFYMVREKLSVGKIALDEIAEFITQSYPNNESGIVCCFSRKECEQVMNITLYAADLLPCPLPGQLC
ncbi:ATP-dependent DNA helicase Q-like 2-like protein [Drosera capensis]